MSKIKLTTWVGKIAVCFFITALIGGCSRRAIDQPTTVGSTGHAEAVNSNNRPTTVGSTDQPTVPTRPTVHAAKHANAIAKSVTNESHSLIAGRPISVGPEYRGLARPAPNRIEHPSILAEALVVPELPIQIGSTDCEKQNTAFIEAAISVRSPAIGPKVDYELSAGLKYRGENSVAVELLTERENQINQWGYSAHYNRAVGQRSHFDLSIAKRTATGTDRQAAILSTRIQHTEVGVGVITRVWSGATPVISVKRSWEVWSVTADLQHITNFGRTSVTVLQVRRDFRVTSSVAPFVKGSWESDGGRDFWRVKGGIGFKF